MPSEKIQSGNLDYGEGMFRWKVDEFEKHVRSKTWYISAISIALIMMLFSFMTANFLFAVIVVISSLVIILHEGRIPDKVTIVITKEGVLIGKRFYDYDDLKNFAIVYKPRMGTKNLYFEFKNMVRQRLSIPLENMDPLPIRENLLKYLPENLDRIDQPLSEQLARIFKL